MSALNVNNVGHDEWLTPKYITDALGPFDLDPCSPINRPWATARTHLTILDDGLLTPWNDGIVWMNPPYGRETPKWIRKMREHNNGIALIFARTDTKMWFDDVFPYAKSLLFIQKRIKFFNVDGTEAPSSGGAPSVIVAYGDEANACLLSASISKSIKGQFIQLNK